MVKIRLMRMGAKRNPHYRVVVVDSRKRRNADYIESLGYYDPRGTVEEPLKINNERAAHWLSEGAQPTSTALKLLQRVGVDVPTVTAMRYDAYTKRGGASKTAEPKAAEAKAAPESEAPAQAADEASAAAAE